MCAQIKGTSLSLSLQAKRSDTTYGVVFISR